MDPISVIVTALVTGASAALKDTASTAIKDAYAGLKDLLSRRHASVDVEVVEKHPDSESRQKVLSEKLSLAGAGSDPELLTKAQDLLEAIERQSPAELAATGVDLDRVKAANIRAKEIVASGTAFRARDVEASGDIDLGTVRAGVTRPKKD
jgi:hypothetical protein